MVKKLVALDLLNTILSKVYTKITNETNEKIELATKGHANDTFIPLTQKAAANGVATLDANGHVPVEQIVDTTDETGNEFDYLSNIENGIDEETGKQKTRIDWRKRVAFRNPNQYIVTTEDSKEDVLVDGTKIGERVVKANVNTLMDLGTLRNYNGQWKTSEGVPDTSYPFSFTETDTPEEVLERLAIFGTPVYNESFAPAPPKINSWRKWEFTPDASYTIYSINPSSFGRIHNIIVKADKRIDGEVITINVDSIHTPPLQKSVEYTIVPNSFITDVLTFYPVGKTSEEIYNELLATGLFTESEGNLIPKQTFYLHNSAVNFVIDENGYIKPNVGHFYAYDPSGKHRSFISSCVISVIRNISANPITKLGVVDEGTWVAGDVTTPHLVANESTVLNKTTTINNDLHITEGVLDFGGTNYDVWDYANDNMNWVEE